MPQEVVWADRVFLTDDDCFASRACDALQTLTEARFESILDEVWIDIHGDYRWVRMTGAGGPIDALVARSWTDAVFASDNGSKAWKQYFHLDAFVEDPTDALRTLRWQVGWMDRSLGLGDDVMRSLLVMGMEESFVFQDEFVQGTATSCDNDISLEKPDRS